MPKGGGGGGGGPVMRGGWVRGGFGWDAGSRSPTVESKINVKRSPTCSKSGREDIYTKLK